MPPLVVSAGWGELFARHPKCNEMSPTLKRVSHLWYLLFGIVSVVNTRHPNGFSLQSLPGRHRIHPCGALPLLSPLAAPASTATYFCADSDSGEAGWAAWSTWPQWLVKGKICDPSCTGQIASLRFILTGTNRRAMCLWCLDTNYEHILCLQEKICVHGGVKSRGAGVKEEWIGTRDCAESHIPGPSPSTLPCFLYCPRSLIINPFSLLFCQHLLEYSFHDL